MTLRHLGVFSKNKKGTSLFIAKSTWERHMLPVAPGSYVYGSKRTLNLRQRRPHTYCSSSDAVVVSSSGKLTYEFKNFKTEKA